MKESSEQHLVIKTHLQNSINPSKKSPKTVQNGKGPPQSPPQSQEPHNTKPHNNNNSQSQSQQGPKNRGRRRTRGGRKSDQGDVFMRPACRPCTVANKPESESLQGQIVVPPSGTTENGAVENGGNNSCDVVMGGFPTSSKSLSFAPRPGYGQVGTKCIVKANHFFAELPDKDLNQYDVSFSSFPL